MARHPKVTTEVGNAFQVYYKWEHVRVWFSSRCNKIADNTRVYLHTDHATIFTQIFSRQSTGVTNTGNGERGTGNGERGTGNREPGTGVWERVHSGNPYKNSKWRTKTRKMVCEPVLSTRSSNSIVGANNMDSKYSIY